MRHLLWLAGRKSMARWQHVKTWWSWGVYDLLFVGSHFLVVKRSNTFLFLIPFFPPTTPVRKTKKDKKSPAFFQPLPTSFHFSGSLPSPLVVKVPIAFDLIQDIQHLLPAGRVLSPRIHVPTLRGVEALIRWHDETVIAWEVWMLSWLVVEPIFIWKIWGKMGSSSPIFGVKMKNVWNHRLVKFFGPLNLFMFFCCFFFKITLDWSWHLSHVAHVERNKYLVEPLSINWIIVADWEIEYSKSNGPQIECSKTFTDRILCQN